MKGHTNNPNGRPKGSQNKVTTLKRSMINNFLADEWNQFILDYKSLTAKERVIIFKEMLQFGISKLQSTQLITDINQLNDDQLNYLLSEIGINDTNTDNRITEAVTAGN